MLTIDKKFISLELGVWEKLTASEDVTWSSNNQNVIVDGNGWVIALRDALRLSEPSGQAVITASSATEQVTCDVTIVTWTANKKALSVVSKLPYTQWFGLIDGTPYATIGTALYRTDDDFATVIKVTDLPCIPTYTPILCTPRGYFMRGQTQESSKVYHSSDLVNWTLAFDPATATYGLYHAFDYYYDATTDTVYVYMCEYSTNWDHRHKLYRGVITSDGTQTWGVALELYAANEFNANPLNTPSCNHMHSVSVDRSNGDVYLGTGDQNEMCWIFYSKDHGDTFRALGGGRTWGGGLDGQYWGQAWRGLSIWFTSDYVYWAMDTASSQQRIWRLAKSNIAAQNPMNDLKELVEPIQNGSIWYHFFTDANTMILNDSPEGRYRDHRGRVYLIKLADGGIFELEEIFNTIHPGLDYIWYTQLHAAFCHNGYYYFKGWGTDHNAMWKMQLGTQHHPLRYVWRSKYTFI